MDLTGKTATAKKDSLVTWKREDEDDFIEFCQSLLNFRTLKDLELRARRDFVVCLSRMK